MTSPSGVAFSAAQFGSYAPGSLLGAYGAGSTMYTPFGSALGPPVGLLQSIHQTIGGVGAVTELVGLTSEAARQAGAASLTLLEHIGQQAGEILGLVPPRPPLDPATGRTLCSPEEHLQAQRARATRWAIGFALVVAIAWTGRAALNIASDGSSRGLRLLTLVAIGAAIGYTAPDAVEDRSRRIIEWVTQLARSFEDALVNATATSAAAPERQSGAAASAAAAAMMTPPASTRDLLLRLSRHEDPVQVPPPPMRVEALPLATPPTDARRPTLDAAVSPDQGPARLIQRQQMALALESRLQAASPRTLGRDLSE